MNPKRSQNTNSIEVIMMLGDGALSKGVESLLLNEKNMLAHSIANCFDESLFAEPRQGKKKIVILDSNVCCQDSPGCLIRLISNPDVEEILMVNSEENLVQVLKKQIIMLTNKEDFAKLF